MINSLPKAIIVYDGDCMFCSKSMNWIADHDTSDHIRFTACTSKTGSALMREHGIDPLDPSTFLVLIDGKPYVQSEAMLRLIPLLDRSVRHLAMLRAIPSPVRDAIYNWTARNRLRFMGKTKCPIPSPAMRGRMLP